MQDASVRKLFQEQMNHYSKPHMAADLLIISFVLKWLKRKKFNKIIEICEFGGGAGQFLNEIRKSYPNTNLTNVEIINDYKRFLISKKIKFVLSSILDSNFPDNYFDVIIMRDVLHHLIGNSYKETQENQKKALSELKRLVRPGGAIFIEELTNESEIATKFMYYLSKVNSAFPFASAFGVNKNTIVAFLTPKRLKKICKEVFSGKITIKNLYKPRRSFKVSQVMHFGAKTSKMAVIVENKS